MGRLFSICMIFSIHHTQGELTNFLDFQFFPLSTGEMRLYIRKVITTSIIPLTKVKGILKQQIDCSTDFIDGMMACYA